MIRAHQRQPRICHSPLAGGHCSLPGSMGHDRCASIPTDVRETASANTGTLPGDLVPAAWLENARAMGAAQAEGNAFSRGMARGITVGWKRGLLVGVALGCLIVTVALNAGLLAGGGL